MTFADVKTLAVMASAILYLAYLIYLEIIKSREAPDVKTRSDDPRLSKPDSGHNGVN